MLLPDDIAALVESEVGAPIVSSEAVGGGCIANATRVRTRAGEFFLKWGQVGSGFASEASGLDELRRASSPLVIPRVISVQPNLLILEWLDRLDGRAPGPPFWDEFGSGLASLHRYTNERYGFRVDNLIGRLPQSNAWRDSWPAFFRECRLEPQVAMARERGRWLSSWNAKIERLLGSLDAILPLNPAASLLHGDLWSGNYLITAAGKAALIDPAVYYGHRETDLAMTELFGGFHSRFYSAYREAWPLEPGYEARREVYNLYHLINHLNHFGSGYAGAVERALTP